MGEHEFIATGLIKNVDTYDPKMRELLSLEPVLELHNFPQYGKEFYR